MECQFSGNVTNIPAVLQPASTCQWFRLLTVCCQRFTHQSIIFLHCEANAYFIGSGCAGSLFSSSRAVTLVSCVSRHALSRSWLAEVISQTSWRDLGNLGEMENISPRSHWDLESYKHHGEISPRSLQSRQDLGRNFALVLSFKSFLQLTQFWELRNILGYSPVSAGEYSVVWRV